MINLQKKLFSPKSIFVNERVASYAFVVPALAFFTLLILIPFIYSVWQSLTSYNLQRPEETGAFVGLDNYRQLLRNDPVFYRSLLNTFEFMFFGILIEIPLGFGIAILLQKLPHRIRRVVLASITIPMILAPVAVGMIWKFLLNPQYGVISYYLNYIGLTFEPVLSNPSTALWAVRAIDIWQWTPFTILVFQAGLSAIPKEYLEAADVDGLSFWLKFRYVILPALMPILIIAILLRLLESFKIFDSVFILTEGGPGNATEMATLYAHRNGFVKGDFSYAAAQVFILNYIVILLCTVLFQFLRRRQDSAPA